MSNVPNNLKYFYPNLFLSQEGRAKVGVERSLELCSKGTLKVLLIFVKKGPSKSGSVWGSLESPEEPITLSWEQWLTRNSNLITWSTSSLTNQRVWKKWS